MALNSLYLLILIFLYIQKTTGYDKSNNNQPRPIYIYKGYLKDPDDFFVTGKDSLIFTDDANPNYPIYELNTKKGLIINKIRNGKGPGEEEGGYFSYSRFSNGDIMIFDHINLRLNIYGPDLSFKNDLTNKLLSPAWDVGLVNDSTLLVVGTTWFLKTYRLHRRETIIAKPLLVIGNNEHAYLNGLNNYALRQFIYLSHTKNYAYLSFLYSSLLMKIASREVKFATLGPDPQPFPKSKQNSLPDVDKHPVCSLDVTEYKHTLFVLYKGEKMPEENKVKILAGFLDPTQAYLELTHSRRVLMFNSENGNYEGNFMLPIAAVRMKIYDSSIYLMTKLHGIKPEIYKYDLNKILKTNNVGLK